MKKANTVIKDKSNAGKVIDLIVNNEETPSDLVTNVINPGLIKTNLKMNDVLNNSSLLEAGMSLGKDGFVYKMESNQNLSINNDPNTDVYDLSSYIYVRSLKAAGLELHDDGSVSKIVSNNKNKVSDNNPLTQNLSDQLDKMNVFDESTIDNNKNVPLWNDDDLKSKSNETTKPSLSNNLNETEGFVASDDKATLKYKKKRTKKSTGLIKNFDPNDPNINLEKLFNDN